MAALRARGSLQDHVMKRHPAIAVVEFNDIPSGMSATDAMLKKAPIAFVKCGTITRGHYLTLIGGSTASVDEALQEGLACGGQSVLDHLLLADVHPRVYEAILGWRKPGNSGALAIIETDTVAANVRAAEAALKGTPVDLIEIRLADTGLSGHGLSVYQGTLPDIEAAIDVATRDVDQSGGRLSHRIISSPHEGLIKQIETSTWFGSQTVLDLDGEVV
jgi:microcompartment protein CcmL/EutN